MLHRREIREFAVEQTEALMMSCSEYHVFCARSLGGGHPLFRAAWIWLEIICKSGVFAGWNTFGVHRPLTASKQ